MNKKNKDINYWIWKKKSVGFKIISAISISIILIIAIVIFAIFIN